MDLHMLVLYYNAALAHEDGERTGLVRHLALWLSMLAQRKGAVQ
jgi:hypothetical protein